LPMSFNRSSNSPSNLIMIVYLLVTLFTKLDILKRPQQSSVHKSTIATLRVSPDA
jgi:hypothetical protein